MVGKPVVLDRLLRHLVGDEEGGRPLFGHEVGDRDASLAVWEVPVGAVRPGHTQAGEVVTPCGTHLDPVVAVEVAGVHEIRFEVGLVVGVDQSPWLNDPRGDQVEHFLEDVGELSSVHGVGSFLVVVPGGRGSFEDQAANLSKMSQIVSVEESRTPLQSPSITISG